MKKWIWRKKYKNNMTYPMFLRELKESGFSMIFICMIIGIDIALIMSNMIYLAIKENATIQSHGYLYLIPIFITLLYVIICFCIAMIKINHVISIIQKIQIHTSNFFTYNRLLSKLVDMDVNFVIRNLTKDQYDYIHKTRRSLISPSKYTDILEISYSYLSHRWDSYQTSESCYIINNQNILVELL